MKKLYFESTTTLTFSAPVVDHYFLLRSIPSSFAGQHILSATLTLTPDAPYSMHRDSFGNINETGCIRLPHDEFIYAISGIAEVDHTRRETEVLNPIYQFPSHYTKLSQKMKEYANSLNLHGTTLEQALQLSDCIYHYMSFQPGSTVTSTTALQTFDSKQGVCQDYSHLYIAIARYLGIPTRYVNGLPVGDGESHAWVEVYIDGIWTGIDPTRNHLVNEDYIRFCTGRDFLDCALERGVLKGNVFQTQFTNMQVIEQ